MLATMFSSSMSSSLSDFLSAGQFGPRTTRFHQLSLVCGWTDDPRAPATCNGHGTHSRSHALRSREPNRSPKFKRCCCCGGGDCRGVSRGFRASLSTETRDSRRCCCCHGRTLHVSPHAPPKTSDRLRPLRCRTRGNVRATTHDSDFASVCAYSERTSIEILTRWRTGAARPQEHFTKSKLVGSN